MGPSGGGGVHSHTIRFRKLIFGMQAPTDPNSMNPKKNWGGGSLPPPGRSKGEVGEGAPDPPSGPRKLIFGMQAPLVPQRWDLKKKFT